MFPVYRVCRSQGCFVDLAMRRLRGNATQCDLLDSKCITRTKSGTNIMHASDIVKHNDNGQLFGNSEFLVGESPELFVFQFSHVAKIEKKHPSFPMGTPSHPNLLGTHHNNNHQLSLFRDH